MKIVSNIDKFLLSGRRPVNRNALMQISTHIISGLCGAYFLKFRPEVYITIEYLFFEFQEVLSAQSLNNGRRSSSFSLYICVNNKNSVVTVKDVQTK